MQLLFRRGTPRTGRDAESVDASGPEGRRAERSPRSTSFSGLSVRSGVGRLWMGRERPESADAICFSLCLPFVQINEKSSIGRIVLFTGFIFTSKYVDFMCTGLVDIDICE